jgi:SNF2 family DNA or RNA helicase
MADIPVMEQEPEDGGSLVSLGPHGGKVTQGGVLKNYTSSPQGRASSVPTDFTQYMPLGAIRLYKAEEDSFLPANLWTMQGRQNNNATFPSATVSHLIEKGCLYTELVDHTVASLRLYVKPDDVDRSRWSETLRAEYRRFIKQTLGYVDRSSLTWDGLWDQHSRMETYLETATDQESLFYIFNTLDSPRPSLERVGDPYARRSITDVLQGTVQGLRTEMYPYQQRSAAMMIQRETYPIMSLDPRSSLYRGPTGQAFYLDKEEGEIRSDPYLYDEPKGGILAETMGYGKTLICLAVILATRGHFPRVPGDQTEPPGEPRPKTASLLEMAARQICRSAIPWKAEFHALSTVGCHYERCIVELGKYIKEYSEPILSASNPSRKGKCQLKRTMKLCFATLVIVPPNLLVQWRYEISKHTENGALDVLVIDHSMKDIPHSRELIRYDVILITKARFEQEYRDDDLHNGKRRKGEAVFQSPLTDLRWLRVICDEGHGFAGSGARTHAMAMLGKMNIERRWVVSGTPSNSLLGVEVGLAANETSSEGPGLENNTALALQARRAPDAVTQEAKDIEKLRRIVVDFLKVQPWANNPGSDYANFRRYLSPLDPSGQRRTVTGLRTLLQSLIVRHRIEDIEIDLSLPPLSNRVAFLEPSFYDKLSINLFVSVLASNAVTSERTDEDYMFHSKNRKQLDLLINNLRQSSFHWVGFKPYDILESIRISKLYLDKNADHVSRLDRDQLLEAISVGGTALEDPGWRAFSTLHEIGAYVEGFPDHASEAWALDGRPSNPLLLGTVQARSAQQHVDARLEEFDPTEGLMGAGLRAMQAAHKRAAEEVANASENRTATTVVEEPKLKDQTTTIRLRANTFTDEPPKKRARGDSTSTMLEPDSPLAQVRIVGFSSAKLSYLMDKVLEHQLTEKILIFYENNNCAFWVAEALELLSVKFLIYSNTLTVARRATYLATFNQKEDFRVLLMDLKQAAHGLHVASASRVYILSPIWQPNIESQAIKRAHRIGQTRPVYVETLVLRDTLEDRMLKRRKQMTNLELQQAEKSLLDDSTMSSMIKQETFLLFRTDEMEIAGRVAMLKNPQPLFGRGLSPQEAKNPEEGLVMTAGDVSLAAGKRKGPMTRKEPESLVSGQVLLLKKQKNSTLASDGTRTDTTALTPRLTPEFDESIAFAAPSSADRRAAPLTTGSRVNVSFLVNN